MNPREIYSSRLGEVVLFKVSRLGYLVLEVSDFPAWEYFGTEILGLMAEKNGSGDALCLRMDGQAQRFRLESGPADDLICLGFEVESEAALEGLAKQLSAGGHAIQECDSETATSRGVPRLFRTNDPSGLEVEPEETARRLEGCNFLRVQVVVDEPRQAIVDKQVVHIPTAAWHTTPLPVTLLVVALHAAVSAT